MKTLLLLLCTIITNEVFSQTFKISDIQYSGDISKEKIQKKKLQALDAKVKLTFYDNSVKIIIYDKDNEEKVEEYILDKTDKNNEYRADLKKGTITLKLKIWINYITSATLETQSKKQYGTHTETRHVIATLKRD